MGFYKGIKINVINKHHVYRCDRIGLHNSFTNSRNFNTILSTNIIAHGTESLNRKTATFFHLPDETIIQAK